MDLIDTHVHLDDEAFAGDLEAVLARATAAGVTTLAAIGTDLDSCRRVIALAERYREVRAVLGIHPHAAGETSPAQVGNLQAWFGHPAVVALGETGLDYYRDDAPRDQQAALFRAHLALADETRLPVVIHCRDAYPEVLTILEDFPRVTCIFHAFSSSLEIAHECIARGHYLALGGPLTFPNARRPVEVARAAPVDRLLLETDAPYLSPHPFRGRRNEPARVRLVAERLAEVRGEPLETVAARTTANARCVFALDPVEIRA